MFIDETQYKLSSKNYFPVESIKKQIILGNTFNHDMRHVIGWLNRYNGKYKKTASFTIDKKGVIHKHFDPKYQSSFFGDLELDKKSIVILLENDGWLVNNTEKNQFITWIGDIYNEPSSVIDKKWRGYNYWCSYTIEQIESIVKLIRILCEEFHIPLNVITHNTKINDLDDFSGILYKSNLAKEYTDLSPAWDCEGFKNKLETNIKTL